MPGECVHSKPFWPLPAWLIAETGIPVILRTSPPTRDPNLDDVSARLSRWVFNQSNTRALAHG